MPVGLVMIETLGLVVAVVIVLVICANCRTDTLHAATWISF